MPDGNWTEDWSSSFIERMQNRVQMSHFKYGSVRKNYRSGNINALETAARCIAKYNSTGNTEYLVDAANYLMFEYMFPQVPGAYFKATDSSESAGIVGISEVEMERLKEEDDGK